MKPNENGVDAPVAGTTRDYYAMLGVGRDATAEEIKRALPQTGPGTASGLSIRIRLRKTRSRT